MNLLIIIGGSWLLSGFIGARLFWYWWSKGRAGFAREPIPFVTTIFGTIAGPFMLISAIWDYVSYPKKIEKERKEQLENEKIRQFLEETGYKKD